ncbi:hypothetical protein [Nocardia sp. NPDC052566]|uniref:hypothetical protein n=1 Tax=Nocardia sp. NPDC052566 TaxID=3364330 RepID=UPI0037C6A704
MSNTLLQWDNGEVTTVSGPYNVTGGVAPPPSTNTVALTGGPGQGGTITVTQAGPDPGALAGPCMSNAARNLNVPIQTASFG